jgi:hypothetical protein
MKRKLSIAFLVATVLLMMTIFPAPHHKAMATQGPRTEDLVLFYYSDVEAAYAALKADEIDAVGYEITAELYQDAILDPNIVLSGVADTGFYEIDINNNHTIHTYPGVESMMWYAPVRRAVAWCTDKDYVVEVICGGFAERIDAMIAAPAKAWASPDHWYPNYPYEYDPAAASAHLDAEGWVQGGTPNPNYDAGFPGSTPNLRTYPVGHSEAGQNVDSMMWYIRTDDLRRNYAGHLTCDALEKIGFATITRTEGDSPTLRPKVMIEKDYHAYTGGWGVGFFPLYLFTIYHSQYWIEDVSSPNYVTGNNESNLPNYPEYDTLAEAVYYPQSLEEAVDAAKNATAYWVDECINVPLFSALSYWASQTKLLGLVNYEGNGFENGYSFMNAYKEDETAFRYGPKSAPNSMNPQFATWYYTYQNIERCHGYAGVSGQPYDPGAAQAGWLQDWEVGKWDDGGTNKTYMTHWVRSDLYYAKAGDPLVPADNAGDQLSNTNASDYFFSLWYTYADPSAWRYSDVQDVHHVEIHDDHSWTTYFDTESYWFYLAASPMLFSVDIWLQDPLAVQGVENFLGWSGTGVVGLSGNPVWINEVTVGGTPLTFGTDYNIILGNLEILTTQTGDLAVDYWKYGNPEGFTPADLPWQDILSGSGMYYMTAFTPGVGGGASFKRNPYYWMETPPLGEIDFVWNFVGTTKPRSGYYDVDIYDVVLAAGAYGSTATGVPSPKYISAADLAPVGGTINIYDIVTITGVYGDTWGTPP